MVSGLPRVPHDPLPVVAGSAGWEAWAECSCGWIRRVTAPSREEAIAEAKRFRATHIAMLTGSEEAP